MILVFFYIQWQFSKIFNFLYKNSNDENTKTTFENILNFELMSLLKWFGKTWIHNKIATRHGLKNIWYFLDHTVSPLLLEKEKTMLSTKNIQWLLRVYIVITLSCFHNITYYPRIFLSQMTIFRKYLIYYIRIPMTRI